MTRLDGNSAAKAVLDGYERGLLIKRELTSEPPTASNSGFIRACLRRMRAGDPKAIAKNAGENCWYAAVNYGLERIISTFLSDNGATDSTEMDGAIIYKAENEISLKCINN